MGASEQVLTLFQHNRALRFAQIQHATGIRSNLLAYTLGTLSKHGMLVKQGEQYVLTATAETRLPYAQTGGALSPLPALLVRCADAEGDILVLKREKRPYDGLWSLPGGRITVGETVEQAAMRILKEKTFLDCSVYGVRAVCNERVVEGNGTKHGFLLLVVDVKATSSVVEKPSIRWLRPFGVDGAGFIPSDHFFLDAAPGVYESVLTPRVDSNEYNAVITQSGSALYPITR